MNKKPGRWSRALMRWVMALSLQVVGVPACAAPVPGSLSANATLATFRTLDPYPAYAMTYIGSYGLDALLTSGADSEKDLLRQLPRILPSALTTTGNPMPVGMACTGFTALSKDGEALFGHNEDWKKRSYLVLTTKPPTGYASISVVDVGGQSADQALRRNILLASPYFPLAGVNSAGLAVSTYTVPVCQPPFKEGKVSLYWPVAIRLLLDRAKTVDEAIALLQTCNIRFTDGNLLQFLIGDAQGHSAVIEWVGGTLVPIRKVGTWQAVTNFIQKDLPTTTNVSCWRYRKAKTLLESQAGRISEGYGVDILRQTAQPYATQFSVLFNLSRRTMHVTFGWEGQKDYRFACP